MEKKYIFVKGVMKLNPKWQAEQGMTPARGTEQKLAVVSSTSDIAEATEAQWNATGKEMQLSDATVSSRIWYKSKAF